MRIVSVNVGLPRAVPYDGEMVETGIFKEPVTQRVAVRQHNLAGDRQADLTVHGGVHKAVYAYPSEHYEFWRGEFPDRELPWSMFGENLTTTGLLETDIHLGDRLRIGTAEFVVTQPRLPCFKLGIKFGRPDIIKRFLASGRTGWYLAISREGELGVGDALEITGRDPQAVSIADLVRLYATDKNDLATMRRAVQVEWLPPYWREKFQERLAKL